METRQDMDTSNWTTWDHRTVAYAQFVLRFRWWVIGVSLLAAIAAAAGAYGGIEFSTNYRVFFSKENPQLLAFEAVQNVYTKNDNLLFVLAPADGQVFSNDTLAAVEQLTEAAWRLPYAIRVDSLSNFQHTYAQADDLVVEDLVTGAAELSAEQLAAIRDVALNEPFLRNQLVSDRAHVTGINVTLQFPEESSAEVPAAVAAARALAGQVESDHPGLDVRLAGVAMLNNAFVEASLDDQKTLVPIMYLGIVVMMMLLLRSGAATAGAVIVVSLSIVTAMGMAGWLGIVLSPPSASAPVIITTLAVADSVHILVTMLIGMQRGANKHDALVESMRVNMQPVFLTSLTTVIGFLSMNFSDAPPFRDLGNITAMGVVAAFFYSVLLLPAVMAVLPVHPRKAVHSGTKLMEKLADWVIEHRKRLLVVCTLVVLVLLSFVPTMKLDDQFLEYFSERIEFRRDSEFTVENLTGLYQVHFSVSADGPEGIADPVYLEALDGFASWYRSQPGVAHVATFSDTMKRLNMNMHGDDRSWYRLPGERPLAAQYLLLYEMSLPFGLDLNNTINIDKSAVKVTVTFGHMTTNEMLEKVAAGERWLENNAPDYMRAQGVGTGVMFAHISARNIRSMLAGTVFAMLLISASLIIAFRSFRLGMLSMIPNFIPAGIAFGIWAITVGTVNVAVSIVAGMTLGIIVDDTVHFMSKYLRGRRERHSNGADAVRYAFSTVGMALVVTSIMLVAGFLILAQSSFAGNAVAGKLSAMTIAAALVADFFLFAPLLVIGDRWLGLDDQPPGP